MQEHTAKRLRISVLLWLLILAITFPYLLHYYEQQHTYQWEEMVQPHWEVMAESPAPVQEDTEEQDVPEWKNLPTDMPTPDAPEKIPDNNVAVEKKTDQKKLAKKAPVVKKNSGLTLKLPENLYRGQAAEWEEKKPVTIPDFFAPKKEDPSRVQLGGKLIVDEDKKKQLPDAGYLDTVKGAEFNIQISTP